MQYLSDATLDNDTEVPNWHPPPPVVMQARRRATPGAGATAAAQDSLSESQQGERVGKVWRCGVACGCYSRSVGIAWMYLISLLIGASNCLSVIHRRKFSDGQYANLSASFLLESKQ